MDFNDTETQYAVLAESLPQLVWSARPNGDVDYVNRRWREYTGRSGEQILGDGWQESVHPDDLERASRIFGEIMSKPETPHLDSSGSLSPGRRMARVACE